MEDVSYWLHNLGKSKLLGEYMFNIFIIEVNSDDDAFIEAFTSAS